MALPSVSNHHVFSSTLGFDYTSNNGDRHLNNYLYLRVNGEVLIMLIDFSRALNFAGWPMPSLPIPANTNTVLSFADWSGYHPFVKTEAEKIIDRWNGLPENKMSEILARMPDEWMGAADRAILCDWWSSDDRIVRGNDAKRSLP
nr:hypothetical protein [uncultured Janthinobacterium sp.]